MWWVGGSYRKLLVVFLGMLRGTKEGETWRETCLREEDEVGLVSRASSVDIGLAGDLDGR